MISAASYLLSSSFARKAGLLLTAAWLLGLSVLGVSPMSGAVASEKSEIVFIDGAVQDTAVLAAAVRPGVETVLLDPTRDELAQMAAVLRGRHALTAVHLISHGAPGALKLGTTCLTERNISERLADLQMIGRALSSKGDFLIYGCEVAQGAAGKSLVRQISALAQVNVAASTNATGAATTGADWVLEYQVGSVTLSALTEALASSGYAHTLAINPVNILGATGATTNVYLGDSFVDSSGNIYITGTFDGSVDFDPSAGTTTLTKTSANSSGDIFVAKYNSDGNLLWAKKMGGDAGHTAYGPWSSSIVVDVSGGVYVGGSFMGTVDFDPGAGTANLTAIYGNSDGFILKLDSSGNYLWCKAVAGPSNQTVDALAVDHSGNLVVGGSHYNATSTIAGTAMDGGSGKNLFIAQFTATGAFNWVKSANGSGGDPSLAGLAVDSSNNVYATGALFGLNFDPGASNTTLTSSYSATYQDGFIWKLTSAGAFSFAKSFHTATSGTSTDTNSPAAIAVDTADNLWVAGGFVGTVDFDPSGGTQNRSSTGAFDSYLVKLTSAGVYQNVYTWGSTSSNDSVVPTAINLDASNNIYLAGYFGSRSIEALSTVDFDPGAGISNLTDARWGSNFYLKLDNTGAFQWARAVDGEDGAAPRSRMIPVTNGEVVVGAMWGGEGDADPGTGVATVTCSLIVDPWAYAFFFATWNTDATALGATVPAPTVSAVTSSIADGAYNLGDSIAITVTFNQAVTVTGTPQLTLETGTIDHIATYNGGSGTNTLTFNYTIQAGDTSADLDYFSTSALALNSGTIANSGGTSATLTLATPGASGSLGANKALVIDTTAPSMAIGSPSASSVISEGASTVTYTVTYADTNFSASTLATGNITLNATGTAGASMAVSGSGLTRTVTLSSITDGGTLGITIVAGTATDTAGNTAASATSATFTVTLPNVAPTFVGSTTTLTVSQDASATDISSLLHVSDTNSSQTLTWSQNVAPNHGGTLTFLSATANTGGTNIISGGTISYTPANGYNGTETFTVQVYDGSATATRQITVTIVPPAPTVTSISPTSGLSIGGTSVTITGTNFIAGSTVMIGGTSATGVTVVNATTITASTPAGSVGAQDVVVTTPGGTATGTGLFTYYVPTTISSVSGPSNATYVAGQNLDFTVNFSQAVNVVTTGGTPYLTLTVGGASKHASYVAGSGTSTLVFRYTIVAGDLDADGTALSADITTNGGTIKDASGNAAILTSAAASFAGVRVDAVAPTINSFIVPTSGTYTLGQNLDVTVAFSEAVTVNTTSGTPYMAVVVGGQTVHANYLSGSGTASLVFRYAVVAGDYDDDNIELTLSISTNGGTIKDAAGNSASIIAGPTVPLSGLKVDAVPPTVASVSPATGLVAGGTSVTITGIHLATATAVKFGTASASITANTDTSITATAPAAGATGPVDVTVTTVNGVSATGAADRFTYVASPGAPIIGTATAGDAQASVAFTAPSDTGGVAIASYTVTSSPGSIMATGSVSPITVTGLTNGTAYTFTVTATNSASLTGPASAASNSVTPSADSTPPTLSKPAVSNIGAGQATLSFTSSEAGRGYFTVLSAAESIGTAIQTKAGQNSVGNVTRHGSLALTAASSANYTVQNLAAATTYTVVFTAEDEAGNLQSSLQTATFTTAAVVQVVPAKWRPVGDQNFSAGQADSLSVTFAPDGTPYVIFVDRNNSDELVVLKFNGTAWVPVGTPSRTALYASLAFSPDGAPWVAFADKGHSFRLAVMRFDGTTWNPVGGLNATSESVWYPNLVFGPDCSPYVGFAGSDSGYKAGVVKFDGSQWTQVGGGVISAGQVSSLRLAFAPDGTLFAAYPDSGYSQKAVVTRYSGGAWLPVGNASGISIGFPDNLSIAVSSDGLPYIAFSDVANGSKATVLKYDGTVWTPLSQTGLPAGVSYDTEIAISPDGFPCVALFGDRGGWSEAVITKFDGAAWQSFVSAELDSSASYVKALTFAPDGKPYVAFTDSANSYRASVCTLATATVITGVDLPAAGYYKAGDALDVVVRFNLPVTLTNPAGGSLSIPLLNSSCYASCASTSNSTALHFVHTVAAGDNGAASVTGFLWDAMGGSITDADGASVDLQMPAVDASGIVMDTSAPNMPSVSVITASAITGYADSGDTIKVYDNGSYLGTTTAGSDHTWQLSVALSDGSHGITSSATDAAGNSTLNNSGMTQVIDRAAPVITSPASASGTFGQAFSCSVTATDPNGLRSYPSSYEASFLPPGLSINPYNGAITGVPTATGSYAVTISAYDTYGNKGTAALAIDIAPTSQTISFNLDSDVAYDPAVETTVTLGGSASSGLPLAYEVAGPAVLVFSSETQQECLLITGTGTVTVTAKQPGNANYIPAADVARSFAVKKSLLIDFGGKTLTATYDGKPHGVVVTTTPAAVAVDLFYLPMMVKKIVSLVEEIDVSQPPTAVGYYEVYAASADPEYLGEAYASLRIIPATPTTPATTTNNTTPVLSGIADPGSTVNVYDGATLLGNVTASAAAEGSTTGTWTFTPTTALTEGTHSITITEGSPVVIKDSAIAMIDQKEVLAFATADTETAAPVKALAAKSKLTPLVSAALTLTIDTTVPAVPVSSTPSGITTDGSPSFTGTAEPGSTVNLYEGTALLGTTTADATTGAWSLTPTSALADGTHGLTVTATDAAGNVSDSSTTCTLIVGTVPKITTPPANKAVVAGSSASFGVVASGTAPFGYQWEKSADGATYIALSGATTDTFSLTSSSVGQTGSYRVVVSNAFGTVTSAAASLSVTPVYTVAKPDGYASATTGGAAGSSVVVLTAADFKTQATSTTACTITVVGQLSIGTVNVASNKTIQGADASAALVGNLNLNGASNVIIRGLHLSNPGTTIVDGTYTDGGDALTITGSSKVFVTHCTFFDCADHDIKIVAASDNVTVSWCEFYASSSASLHRYSVQIGAAGETQAQHVTLHHNWWTTNLDQQMPFSSYGHVHQYNNYVDATGNTAGTVASDHAQLLSERNVYANVANPLTKHSVSIASFVAGRIRTIGNIYTNCTGSTPDAGTDSVFTPNYSYEMLPASDVAIEVEARAGNTAGADYADAPVATASISQQMTTAARKITYTLTAVPSGFTAATHQWRLGNADIAGATSSTYTVASTQDALAGTYTVALTMASGDTVVSSPKVLSIDGEGDAATPRSAVGGGAPGLAYLAALALLGSLRLLRRARR